MASPRSAWGIDIGNRALKAVKLVRSGEEVRVDDFEFIEHDSILSQSGDNREEMIRKAIAEFSVKKGTKHAVVAIGVSGQSSFARFIKLPPVESKRIPEIVRFEAIQQIPFPLDDVEWSYQLFQSDEQPDVEVGIFAMRKELVNAQVKQFTDVNLNVQVVQTNPLAVYNAVQRDGRLRHADGSPATAMIIDVGAETTDLIIASDSSIWLRSIPIGGNNFTEVIQKAFKVNSHKAEELKRNAQSSKYARQIFQTMRPVFADLVAEIQRSVGFYGSVNRDQKIDKIIALGGTFRLPALPKYLEQNLQLPVERPDSFGAGMPTDTKQAATMTENILSLHAAYGLALQAMDEAKVSSSLLPTAIRREKFWKEKTKWFAAAAALVAVGTGVAYGRYFIDRLSFDRNSGIRQNNQDVLERALMQSNEWSAIQNSGGQSLATIRNMMSLNDGAALWSFIVRDVMAAIPDPSPEIAAAIEDGNSDVLKKTPRDQRRVIKLESLKSEYVLDINDPVQYAQALSLLDSNQMSALPTTPGASAPSRPPYGGSPEGSIPPAVGPDGLPLPAKAPPVRGFVVTMRILSSFAQAPTLADTALKSALSRIAPSAQFPTLQYKVQDVEVRKYVKVAADPTYLQRLVADYNGRMVAETAATTEGSGTVDPRRGYGTPSAQPTEPTNAAFRDPFTDEDVRGDYLVDLVFRVALDPPPFVAPEATASVE